MAGCVGGEDKLGGYVRQQLRAAGVGVVKPADRHSVGSRAAAAGPGSPIAPAAAAGGATPGEAAAAAAAAARGKSGVAAGGGATTGTVMVFCTPDAQRSFLSCIPGGDVVALTPELLRAAARSRMLVIEGYLLDLPGAAMALPGLVAACKAAGTVVALTLGDAGVGESAWGQRGPLMEALVEDEALPSSAQPQLAGAGLKGHARLGGAL
jgi:sugar/nucleoside kinase (ribokinase family)